MTGSTGDRTGLGDVDSPDVREIKIERTKLTYRSPINTARGPVDRREVVVLTLTDGEGRVGLGEAAPLTNFTPESVDEAELAIHRWADDGTLPADSPTARAAIDGALLDLAARAASRPVHDLLAPGSSGIVPVSAFVGGDTTDDLATAAAEAMAMLHAAQGRRANGTRFFVDAGCHPQTIAVIDTRARWRSWEIVIPHVVMDRLEHPAHRPRRRVQRDDGALHALGGDMGVLELSGV